MKSSWGRKRRIILHTYVNQCFEAEDIYMHKKIIVDSDKGLSPVWFQAIIWINSVVCKMVAILSRPQSVNPWSYDTWITIDLMLYIKIFKRIFKK